MCIIGRSVPKMTKLIMGRKCGRAKNALNAPHFPMSNRLSVFSSPPPFFKKKRKKNTTIKAMEKRVEEKKKKFMSFKMKNLSSPADLLWC